MDQAGISKAAEPSRVGPDLAAGCLGQAPYMDFPLPGWAVASTPVLMRAVASADIWAASAARTWAAVSAEVLMRAEAGVSCAS